LGFILLVIGVILIFVATLAVIILPVIEGEVKISNETGAAVCILVAFIPICFGAGRYGLALTPVLLTLLAVVIAILLLLIPLAYIIKFKSLAQTS